MSDEQQTKIDAPIADWSEVSEKANKFFKADIDKGYKVTFSNVTLEKKAFKKGDEPKLKAICKMQTIDGQPTEKVWETGSFQVMKELKKHVVDNQWKGISVVFFLKRKENEGKTTFVFEELGSVEAMA